MAVTNDDLRVPHTRRSALNLALTVVLLFIPSSLHAWAREGHEIIAMIAEQRLQPEVREQVNILLGRTSFVKASMWADGVRGKETLKIKFMTHVGCRKFFLKA